MIISYGWLNEMVNLPVSSSELVEVLTYLGLEVEQTTTYTPCLENVIVGEILECSHIEGTDHLSITKTNIGGEVLPIVCGAPNARAGLKVAVMLAGSVTADGTRIKKAKLRGFESHGMLASERELGLVDEHLGIIEGEADWIVGKPAADYLNLPDTVYDVEITPNRPDYLSHVGVARDVAAKFKLPWRWPEYPLNESNEPASTFVSVEILAPDACPRYTTRAITDISIKPSPFAMRLRLMRCGTRPISNIVDATNLLMLEFGQPLHAFDARFIHDRKIVVRMANAGEKFTTLDGVEHKLNANDLLIADPAKGIALAGIMGGLNSEIRDDTTDVIIECAYFDSVQVRRSAKTHGIGTESSRRFERGTDPNGVPRVVDATASLMNRLAGGSILKGRVDSYPTPINHQTVSFRPKRVAVVVGVDVPHAEQKDILSRLGCEVKDDGETWQVTCPTCRPDLEREIDLVEEVIRVYGYDKVPTAIASRVPLRGHDDELTIFRRRAVDAMVSLGFQETLSLSMYEPNPRHDPPGMPPGVALKNPVTDEMPVLHGTLLPHLVHAAAANWKRGDRDLRLFEVARVFHEGEPADPRTWECQTLAAVLTGSADQISWARPAKSIDFYDLKGVLEGLAAKISLDKIEIICYDIDRSEVLSGEVHSNGCAFGKWGIWPAAVMSPLDIGANVAWIELDLGIAATLRRSAIQVEALPRFPISWRDVALVMDENLPAEQIRAAIRKLGGDFLVRTEPIDVFRGEKLGQGKKSVAIRIEFSHPDRSLESAEVDGWMSRIVDGLREQFGAALR